jgi:hypothetical protein
VEVLALLQTQELVRLLAVKILYLTLQLLAHLQVVLLH